MGDAIGEPMSNMFVERRGDGRGRRRERIRVVRGKIRGDNGAISGTGKNETSPISRIYEINNRDTDNMESRTDRKEIVNTVKS